MNPRGEQKVWIEYSVGERVLLDGEVYEVVSTQRNRWGGPTCRVGTVEGGRKRWLTPRTEGQHAAVVDKRAIGDVIERFYERVRGDDLLAPVFDAKVSDWDAHRERMGRTWCGVFLGESAEPGAPPPAYGALRALDAPQVDRWAALFEDAARDVFVPELAAEVVERARKTADALRAEG